MQDAMGDWIWSTLEDIRRKGSRARLAPSTAAARAWRSEGLLQLSRTNGL